MGSEMGIRDSPKITEPLSGARANLQSPSRGGVGEDVEQGARPVFSSSIPASESSAQAAEESATAEQSLKMPTMEEARNIQSKWEQENKRPLTGEDMQAFIQYMAENGFANPFGG